MAEGSLPLDLLLYQSFQFGDLLFEGIRFSEHGVLHHAEHRERMYSGAHRIDLPMPEARAYDALVAAAVRSSGLPHGYLRIFALRDVTGWGVDCRMPHRVAPLLTVTGQITLHHGDLRLMISTVPKPRNEAIDTTIKCGGSYLNNKRALMEAMSHGYNDAIMLSAEGHVSEAVVENVFWVRKGELFTPAADARTNCLPGITRHHIISSARRSGLKVHEGHFPAGDLLDAEEVFLTGTGAGVLPVHTVERRPLRQPMTLTTRLRAAYESGLAEHSTPISSLDHPYDEDRSNV